METKSFLQRVVNRVLPATPDFFTLVDEQCDQAVLTLDELVSFMESNDAATAKHVRRMEKEGDELKRRNLDILNKAFSTPMDREDIYRAIVDVDHLMNYAKTTVREMELFAVAPDSYTLQMAVHLKDGTDSLRQGFRMLRKEPSLAEAGAEAAHKAERNVEKVYRKALAELFDVKTTIETLEIEQLGPGNGEVDQTQMLRHVMERLKRREIYRHLSNSADRLARAGNTLHDIVIKIA